MTGAVTPCWWTGPGWRCPQEKRKPSSKPLAGPERDFPPYGVPPPFTHKTYLAQKIRARITPMLNSTLTIKVLKVILLLRLAKTAALKAIQKMVTKKSRPILGRSARLLIKRNMAAAEPRQLWPMIPMVAYPNRFR